MMIGMACSCTTWDLTTLAISWGRGGMIRKVFQWRARLRQYSPYMISKQSEMDHIVKEVYAALETKDHLKSTLLIMCGDHGMNDAGNHGGSSESETSPALVFVSPKLRDISRGFVCPTAPVKGDFNYYRTVEQSDIAPTIAGLLGFPVPLNNLGVFIPEFLMFWKESTFDENLLQFNSIADAHIDDRARILEHNAAQILRIVKETFPRHAFDTHSAPQRIPAPNGDGAELESLWNTAEVALSVCSQSKPEEVLQALTHV